MLTRFCVCVSRVACFVLDFDRSGKLVNLLASISPAPSAQVRACVGECVHVGACEHSAG